MAYDIAKLDELRRRYASAAGGDMYDPHFKAVAAQVFADADTRKWPFAGPATFIDAPFRPDGLTDEGLGALDVALIGVPMDLGVTNRAGSRLGPRAVRGIERVGPYEHVLRVAPMARCGSLMSAMCRCGADTAWPIVTPKSRPAIAGSRIRP